MEDISAQLLRLDQLRGSGALSESEFQELKKKLISGQSDTKLIADPAPRRLSRAVFALIAVPLLFIGMLLSTPLIAEGASNPCDAFESRFLRLATKEQPDTVGGKLASSFMLLVQRASNGMFASSYAKQSYPSLPPAIACTVAYYRSIINPAPTSLDQVAATNNAAQSTAAQPSLNRFAAAPAGLSPSKPTQLQKFQGKLTAAAPDGVEVEERISTVAGPLELKLKKADGLYERLLVWNEKALLTDRYMGIDGAFPTSGSAKLVIAHTYGGGTCCTPTPHIIDLSQKAPFVSEGLDLVYDAVTILDRRGGLYSISGTSDIEKNKLGDRIPVTYLYDASVRRVIRSSYDGTTDFGKFVGRHPDELLGDDAARKPLVALLGERFREFREHIQVSTSATLKDMRYIVGQGCTPHQCDSSGGIYIVDVATGKAWVRIVDDGQVQGIGEVDNDSDFAVQSVFNEWQGGSR